MSVAELQARERHPPALVAACPTELVVPINDDAKASLADLPLMYAPPIPRHGPARAVHVVKPRRHAELDRRALPRERRRP